MSISGSFEAGNQKVVFGNGNLTLVLEQAECFPADPGQGTPAMVYLKKVGEFERSGTFWCCTEEGELDGYPLAKSHLKWLESKADEVEKYTEAWYTLAKQKGK